MKNTAPIFLNLASDASAMKWKKNKTIINPSIFGI